MKLFDEPRDVLSFSTHYSLSPVATKVGSWTTLTSLRTMRDMEKNIMRNALVYCCICSMTVKVLQTVHFYHALPSSDGMRSSVHISTGEMMQDICWEATHQSLSRSDKICLGKVSDGQHCGFTCARIFSMLSLIRGYPELMSTDWELIAVPHPQTKQLGPSEYYVLRLRSLNTALATKDHQFSSIYPSKPTWRIGTVRNHKLSRQSFTKSVIHLKEDRFPSFPCSWIVVVSKLLGHAPVACLTTCSIQFEPLLFRHAYDARPRSPHAESWYTIKILCRALPLFGSWIADHAERDAAINVLRKVDQEDAWPTSSLQRDLRAQWESRE